MTFFKFFDHNNFWHFRALLKQKGQPEKIIVNSRHCKFLEDVNHHIVLGPENFFEYRRRPWKATLIKVIRNLFFASIFMGYLLAVQAFKSP